MFAVLQRIGSGDCFLSWIRALYDNPTARVRANGALSATFDIHNGTRQGCPLSPLLFSLTLEPLLTSIRSNVDIKGLDGQHSCHKISAYADDLLFLITDPSTSLPAITAVLDTYGEVSGYRINRDKSELLNITLDQTAIRRIRHAYPFRYCAHQMKYLGVWLAPSTKQILESNFFAILKTFRSDLSEWNGRMISWLGRIAALKMNLLPRLLYLFGALPIMVPLTFFTALRTALLKFIWPTGRPRVSFATLCKPKHRGGLALPDSRRYYLSSHLTRLIDWSAEHSNKRWLDLESALAGYPLWTLPWLPPGSFQVAKTDPDPVSATLRLWHKYKLTYGLSTAISPLLPLVHNPSLPGGIRPSLRTRLTEGSRLRAIDLPSDGNLDVLPTTSPGGPLSPLDSFNFLQIKSYLRSLHSGYSLGRQLLPFELLCQAGTSLTHGISALYSLLQAADATIPTFFSRWDRELAIVIPEEKWTQTFVLIHKGSCAAKIQETSYKIAAFWYRSPSFLHQVYPSTASECWRCELESGTYLHIWWSCPNLGSYWTRIRDIILQVTDVNLPLTPECFLLLHIPLSFKVLKRSVLLLMLFASRALIPTLWKSTRSPSIDDWIRRVEEYRSVDLLDAEYRGKSADSAMKWYHWEQFTASNRASHAVTHTGSVKGLSLRSEFLTCGWPSLILSLLYVCLWSPPLFFFFFLSSFSFLLFLSYDFSLLPFLPIPSFSPV
uniref:Reverse transcriptase domain-containing protein n=1 Tax=Leptobrachium leishanense TaxID=445787 RepID=A0A8C5PA41_9ANUR